jgi:hypothetical protein
METTFDLRNGKHSIRKLYHSMVPLSESSWNLYLVYMKYKVGMELKGKAENSKKKLDISTISIM